jgi:hypothetical protein
MNNRILLRLSLPIGIVMIVGIVAIIQVQPRSVSESPETNRDRELPPVPENPALATIAANPSAKTASGAPQTASGDAVAPDETDFPLPPENTERYWEERLFKLLNNDRLSDRELGQQLAAFAADSKASRPVRLDALRNALIYIDDAFYEQDIKPLALKTDLTQELYDTIFDDLTARDPSLSLPVAKTVSSLRQHPMATVMGDWVAEMQAAGE